MSHSLVRVAGGNVQELSVQRLGCRLQQAVLGQHEHALGRTDASLQGNLPVLSCSQRHVLQLLPAYAGHHEHCVKI